MVYINNYTGSALMGYLKLGAQVEFLGRVPSSGLLLDYKFWLVFSTFYWYFFGYIFFPFMISLSLLFS